MVYDKDKTKGSVYCYFNCKLCGLPSRVSNKTVNPKNPVWHISTSYREGHPPTASNAKSQPPRSAPVVSQAKRKNPERAPSRELSERTKLADELLVILDDIHDLGKQRAGLLEIESEQTARLKEADEFVKKCKQECIVTRGEILKVDEREKELRESVPEIVRALASGK